MYTSALSIVLFFARTAIVDGCAGQDLFEKFKTLQKWYWDPPKLGGLAHVELYELSYISESNGDINWKKYTPDWDGHILSMNFCPSACKFTVKKFGFGFTQTTFTVKEMKSEFQRQTEIGRQVEKANCEIKDLVNLEKTTRLDVATTRLQKFQQITTMRRQERETIDYHEIPRDQYAGNIQIEDEVVEYLRTKQIVQDIVTNTRYGERRVEKEYWTPVDPDAPQEPCVTVALGAWTTALKHPKTIKYYDEKYVLDVNQINATPQEIKEQFQRPAIWKRIIQEGFGGFSINLLIIRKIDTNLYECTHMCQFPPGTFFSDRYHWMDTKEYSREDMYYLEHSNEYQDTIPNHYSHSTKKHDVEMGWSHEIQWKQLRAEDISIHFRFVIEGHKELYLWEKSNIFLEQRLQSREQMEKELMKCENDRRQWEEHMNPCFELEARFATSGSNEIKLLNGFLQLRKQCETDVQNMVETESAERVAIQSNTEEQMKFLEGLMAAVSKQSMRSLELQKRSDDLDEENRKSTQMIKSLQDASTQFQQRSGQEDLESVSRQITETEAYASYKQLRIQKKQEEARRRLEDTKEREAALIVERAQREIRQVEERETLQRELDRQQQEAFHSKEEHRQKESENEYLIIIALLIGGSILAVIGFTIFVLARISYHTMCDNMEYELNEQLKRVKQPHPLVPEYPSAHANRLGVHEHPAVRDVFGMKEPWDVTPGEGFHVSRVTGGQETTRGTTRDFAELKIRIEGPNASNVESPSQNGSEDEQYPSVIVGLPPPHPGIDMMPDISEEDGKIVNEGDEGQQVRAGELFEGWNI